MIHSLMGERVKGKGEGKSRGPRSPLPIPLYASFPFLTCSLPIAPCPLTRNLFLLELASRDPA
jgi:hypothetical protein